MGFIVRIAIDESAHMYIVLTISGKHLQHIVHTIHSKNRK